MKYLEEFFSEKRIFQVLKEPSSLPESNIICCKSTKFISKKIKYGYIFKEKIVGPYFLSKDKYNSLPSITEEDLNKMLKLITYKL